MQNPGFSESRLFVLVAGEASGDLLGAGLIAALRERFPQARFIGIGGPRMIAAGLDAWYGSEKLAVMGLVEVLRHLPELLAIRRDTLRRTLREKPDAFIGIDAPDFNLGLERKLKRTGIATVHYVSPSVWAWRERRAAKIGRSADRVLCLFPMEPPIYARHGVDARFVGHPLADAFALDPDQQAARATLGLPADVPILALLPGSRLGEIARIGADFIAAAQRLRRDLPALRIVAPMANAACRAAFARQLSIADSASDVPSTWIELIDGRAHEAMLAADAVLLASGTATLEAMLAKRPMVVAYRIARMTHALVKGLGLLKVRHYALPNILSGRELVPELMQDALTPEALAAALLPMLRARGADPLLLDEFRRLHAMLRCDASRSAADAVADLLARRGTAMGQPD
ncbi:MAG: lipid-A-disaccharide synthase [Rhodanobacter sp.]|nr:lipid-A-disaccharide synthase [Rhodanobacter sp.]